MNSTIPSSAHTPTPWLPIEAPHLDEENAWEIVTEDGIILAQLGGPLADEEAANARIMAAAPELLEILKKSIVALEDGSIADSGSEIPYLIQQVIAKAEGR